MHAVEAISSSKTPCRKGVKYRKGTAYTSCIYFQNISCLVRKLERCAMTVYQPRGLGASYILWRKTLIFCGSCLTDGYFSLHGNALEHWTTGSPFLKLGACYWLVGIHLPLWKRLEGVFNRDLFISGISKSAIFLWTLYLMGMWMLGSKCICVPDRLRGEGLACESAALWIGEQGGETCMLESTSYVLPCHLEVCWQVLQLVMGQHRGATLESPAVNTPVRDLWKKRRGNWKQS